jgi:serpin B
MRIQNLALALALGFAALQVGCAADSTSSVTPDASFDVAKSSLARDTSPNATAAEMQKLAEGNAEFAMRLYGETAAKSEGNAFFSPLSVTTALAMTYGGAKGQTADEMAAALSFKLPADRLHVAMNALDLALSSRAADAPASTSGKPFALRSVNTTFGQKGFPFEAPYLDNLAKNYGAGVQLADFKADPNAERLKINGWVERQTESRIKDLLGEGTIDRITRMVLVNAVYFNADWASPFEKELTQTEPFTKLDGSKIDAPLMHQELSVPYLATDALEAIELPYEGRKVSMVVVLPKGDFKTFEKSFDGAALLSTMAGLKAQGDVRVALPKFELAGEAIRLSKPLKALGMDIPFSEEKADFSGIVSPSVDKLHIDEVIHKAFVRVDEKGTEAAAATAVVVAGTTSLPVDPPKVFRADRPFLVFIRDIPTNAVLFAGRIVSPK